MKPFKKIRLALAAAFVLPTVVLAAAASDYSLFGNAVLVSPGNASPTGVKFGNDPDPFYGGVGFAVPATFTVADLNNLSTDYMFTAGSCGSGSPRFAAGVFVDGDPVEHFIFFYFGDPPDNTGCPADVWLNTGNLAAPTSLVDATQLPGGLYNEPYAAVQAAYGSLVITDLFIVADPSFAATQIVEIDNTMVNDTIYTYETPTPTPSPTADLSVTKTDGKTTVSRGEQTTYTIVVTNSGPDGVTGAEVSDIFPWQITKVTYTATSTGGATGFTPNGSGRISDTVNMPAGSTITYQATGTVSPIAKGKIRNLASVKAPAETVDPQPGNDRASDFDYVTR